MDIRAILAAHRRDLRLDLFRGIANWFIFLDHIPDNVVNWITVRNYGFSGAADLFIFTSGYAVSIVYARMMLERGFLVGATRLFKRAWQLYAAYVVLFVIYVVTITNVAAQYAAPDIIYEFNIAGLVDHPIRMLAHGLFLESRALNLDVLQLYVILMALFPPVFNPFCWQLLFVFGAWLALGGVRKCRSVLRLPMLSYFGIAYLVFALVMKMAGRFPALGELLPAWLLDAFIPVDKTNLGPYRVLHFILVVVFVTRFLSIEWRGLEWRIFKPIIKCGEQSLAVFCAGVFLSFAGHFALITSSDTLFAQVLVSAGGIAIMTFIAYYISWSKEQDGPQPNRRASADAKSGYTELPGRTFAN
jgi:hypothetical protein